MSRPPDLAVVGNGRIAALVNNQGQLVTSEGLQVIGQNGAIVFQPNDRDISIGLDGTISVREGTNTTDSQRGKLKLVTFAQPQRLEHSRHRIFDIDIEPFGADLCCEGAIDLRDEFRRA